MGREFVELFNRWADNYDKTVQGVEEEYRAVFEGYDAILQEVAHRSSGNVLEFGAGTGNLSSLLLHKADKYMGVEPSEKMRKISEEKLAMALYDGDFLSFSKPSWPIHTIVSTYAFHHLTDKEKAQAAAAYSQLLSEGGKVVFADTIFINDDAKHDMIKKAESVNYLNLAQDLQTEYYTTLPILQTLFETEGFTVDFKKMNSFVWIMEAVKS
ncbi:class I SAM-dependent methyltransferase [Salipaludibacillus sp. LMS25]|jgi:putative AdoMet-dependent methyltransferase|uniref:class I SAM-dependent DNA methyltransferase n=1 Tax=Salipaludibacillus sp. LMS25 TaxID=2924031 RepID=UPI0020D12891|nr:class I SAM-dependent methyltransferase [Salipaludibacillus sp. LMS25]UTR13248.1 class I SAM-dependent methyltransferase [Salipaludibacillus sp. LMS25]